MIITIVGGGNIGTQFAVHCAEKGYEVIIYTSTPDLYDGQVSIVDENGAITHTGSIYMATDNPELAFKSADVILVTVPAMMMKSIAELVYIYSKTDVMIGVVPGNGGGECAFRKCIDRGSAFFGIERVPAIARLVQKGKTVRSTGYREELHVASLPKSFATECSNLVEDIFGINCRVIPSFLNLTMTPSNPILHTTRLKTIFSDWEKGKKYKHLPLFYEEWDDASSELLLACDEEVQAICHALPQFDLQYVKSLKLHYESSTAKAMTKKISSIPAFRGLTTPSIQVDGGFIPDLHSRYFTADFSYGLTIIQQIAGLINVNIPNIDATMAWYRKISVEKEEFNYNNYGITDMDSFCCFYMK